MSEGVVANKHDERYTVGYEVEPGEIMPLCIKTPKDCLSSGVSRFNEASPWKMGFNVMKTRLGLNSTKESGGVYVKFYTHLVVVDSKLVGV